MFIESFTVICLIALLAFPKIKIYPSGEYNDEYLSLSNTLQLRGFMAVLIVIHHLSGWFSAASLLAPFKFIGYLIVAVFFFISGYGLYYGFCRKTNYLKNFLRNRLPNVYIPYFIFTIIWSIGLDFTQDKVTFKDFILSLVGYRIFLIGGWYIVVLIIMYILFYVSFRQDKINRLVLFFLLFSAVFAAFFIFDKTLWLRSLLSFPIGILWCKYKDKIDEFFKKHYSLMFFVCILVFVIFVVVRLFSELKNLTLAFNLSSILTSSFFTLIVIISLKKISLNNKVLVFLGKISNEIYLLHYLFLILLSKSELISSHIALFVICTFLTVIPVAYLLNKLDIKLVSLIKK